MGIRNELLEKILDATFDIRNNATIAGYGGISIDSDVIIGTVGATPVTLTGFDSNLIQNPRGVIQNLSNNSLALSTGGVWTALFKVSLTFDELNAGRQISLRLYNYTTGVAVNTRFNFFVGRNADGVNLNVALPFEVVDASLDEYQVQILSNDDEFTNVTCIGATYSFTNNSPITGL